MIRRKPEQKLNCTHSENNDDCQAERCPELAEGAAKVLWVDVEADRERKEQIIQPL